MSRISVYVRMRPVLENQFQDDSVKEKVHLDQKSNQISVELSQKREKVFKFDGILNDTSTQDEVYDCIDMQNLVNRVVEGFHSTIFAYGQTGSGKTFTIEGQSVQQQNMGLIPRSISNLFQSIKNKQNSNSGFGFKVYISFLQIYNEQIYDLIDVNKKPLKMRWNKYQQFVVENLFQGQCRDENQAISWWKKGQKSKIIDSHNMNKQSSRSHCILTLRVKSFQLQDPSNCIESKLQIVDLAGSQRQKVTKSTGIVFREGIQINKSLFALRQVIAALYESNTGGKTQNLPPYRDSKLTSLLKQSIGGNAYCAMIACINPTLTHFQQSLQTLTYASMATYINNVPLRNIDPKIRQNEVLKQHNYNLKQQIRKLSDHVEYLTSMLQKNQCSKCGSTNTIKVQGIDERIQSNKRSQKRNTQTNQDDELFKLPKFTNVSDTRLPKKQVSKDGSFYSTNNMNQTQSKQFKKRLQKQERSITLHHQPTPKSGHSDYQLKNPKQILESITMIRDLIHTNTKLRDKIQLMREQNQKMERQTYQIMQENQLLRERWQMLGSNLKVQTETQNQAPISLYERLLKQQKGQGLVYMPSQTMVTQYGQSQYNKNGNQSIKNGINQSGSIRKSIKRQSNTQVIVQSQKMRQYRPYNEILRNGSKKKKQILANNRKRNLSYMNKNSESFVY